MKIIVGNKRIHKLISDKQYRNKVTFYVSVFSTTLMALFNGTLGVVYLSVWYGSLAVYYIALAGQRLYVFLRSKWLTNNVKDSNLLALKANTLYFINGIIVIAMIFALSFSVVQMVLLGKPIVAGKITAITIATYTFYKITMAVINLVKDNKTNDKIAMTIRNINLVDALVSILSLTVTLLTTFGSGKNWSAMIICVSTGISTCIVALGVIMIVKSKKTRG